MRHIETETLASLALFLAASAWGLYWMPLRAMESMGFVGAWSVAYFNLFPGLLLVPYVVWNARRQLRHGRKVAMIALMTGVGLGCYATALVLSSVIRVTMLFYLTPIWATIIGAVWLGEPLSRRRILAIAAGLAGLILLLSGTDDRTVPLNAGDFLALASGILWGLGAAAMKRWPEAPIVAASMWQFLIAVAVCIGMAALVLPDPAPTPDILLRTFPVAFLASGLVLLPSIFVIFWASRIVYPGRGGILMMSEVMVAILSASLLLPEETMTVRQWTGGAIILLACLIEVGAHRKTLVA